MGRHKIKTRLGRRWLKGKSFRLVDEVRHIQHRAAEHDGRVVTVGPLVLFSTASGDAWVTANRLAAPVARDGDPLAAHIEETDAEFAIGWTGHYRIDGAVFVYTDNESGRIRAILGYPTQRISQQA